MSYILLATSNPPAYDHNTFYIQIELTEEFVSLMRLRWALYDLPLWGVVEPPQRMEWWFYHFNVYGNTLNKDLPDDIDPDLRAKVSYNEVVVSPAPLSRESSNIQTELDHLRISRGALYKDALITFEPKHSDVKITSAAFTPEHVFGED